jgi:hypothetical protein
MDDPMAADKMAQRRQPLDYRTRHTPLSRFFFRFLQMPRLNWTLLLVGLVVLLLLANDVAAFGAGNIPS